MLLGGYAAEEERFGEVTTGSSGDLAQAAELARSMVAGYGMGEGLRGLAFGAQAGVSQETRRAIDEEVKALVAEALDLASRVVAAERARLDRLTAALLAEETLDEARLAALLGPRPLVPPVEGAN